MNSVIHVAGWTLVHFAWQGALIGGAAALVLRLLRGPSPQSRYLFACIALSAMLMTPAVTAWRLASGDHVAPELRGTALVRLVRGPGPAPAAGSPGRHLVMVRVHGPAAVARAGLIDLSGPAAWPWLMPALVAAWLSGVCLLLVRLVGGWRRVRLLQAAATALAPSSWQGAADALTVRLGLRGIRVVDASFIDSPLVVGWLQPIVLLPVAAVAGLSADQILAVLAHELAHVRRHDALVNIAQGVAETLLFYHPAVWWLSSRIRVEREHCCDDVALAVTGDAVGYASALAELESWRIGDRGLAMAATGGSLMARITRLLAPAARKSRASAIVTVALVLAFVVGAGALQILVARQPATIDVTGPAQRRARATAWRVVFEHASGQMTIRGFTGRELVRYAYQLPMSRVIGGPDWLDRDAIELVTTVDHEPAGDETPALVRQLLEDRFGLRVHESTTAVPVFALEVARADGALGPGLQPATGECFDQQAWVAAGAPPQAIGPGQRAPICGVWDDGIDFERVRNVTMDDLASVMRPRFAPEISRDVVNRTGLYGAFDLSVEFFKPAAAVMAATPSLRRPLRAAGFVSASEAIEEQLGLKLVPATASARALVIDEIHRPLEGAIP